MSNHVGGRAVGGAPPSGKKVVVTKPVYSDVDDIRQPSATPDDEEVISSFEVDDPDATPKLEKKAAMSQIISSLKLRFGNHSGRKKGKKSKAGSGGRETCCTRLLWNSNGHWKDNWFTYEDGTLSGYREQGVKPADVTIKVKTSKLTVYGSDEFMRKLNLFKITTVCNVAHIFAAWNEEEYDTWIDILTYTVGKKYEQVSFNIGNDRSLDEECYDNDIIPYDEGAIEREQRKLKERGKRMTDSRGESIDSGNDGDESGLESSVSSLSLFESRKRIERERRQLGRTASHSSIPEINNKNERNSFIRCSSEKDILKNTNQRNTSQVPTLQYQTYGEREIFATNNDKNRRPTSYPQSHNTTCSTPEQTFRTPSPLDKASCLKVPGKGGNYEASRKQTPAYHQPTDSMSSTPEYYVTSDNRLHHVRQCSTDTYLHLNDVAIDSSSSGQHIDVTDASPQGPRPKVSVASYTDDSTHAHTSIVEVRNKLEDTLREETLLKRRRNSLNLELDLMKGKLDELKETPSKRNSKEVPETFDRSKHIEMLEKKSANIEDEIKTIDKRISAAFDPTPIYNDKKRKSSNIMKRLRSVKSKDNLLVHSMSVESLTSTASHDSSVGRESPYLAHKNDGDAHRHSYIPTCSRVDERTSDNNSASNSKQSSSPVQSSSPGGLNGFETLLRTTELLENGEFPTSNKRDSTSSESDTLTLSARSKSMSAVDKISKRNFTSNHGQSKASVDVIIEDFEKFSAMLMQTHHMKASGQIIDV